MVRQPAELIEGGERRDMLYIIRKLKNLFHLVEAVVANIYYRFPSRRLKMIGITGTDGKTTTVHLIYHILKSSGKKVSMISTVKAKIDNQVFETGLHTTTPSCWFLQKLLKKAADLGNNYFVLEVTSHGLDQNRVFGINFEIGLVTNITHEHLDYHGSYERYLEAKLKLLKNSKIRFINQEDDSFQLVKDKKLTFKTYHSRLTILNKIPGLTQVNRENFSAAYVVCKQLGLPDNQILAAMKSFKLPPGRMELVYNGPFRIVIDFAHTPNAFARVLPEIRKKYLLPGGRLIHIFGAAGLRDFKKRPLMGRISSRFADKIILTEEDYRTEDPKKIAEDIARGIKDKKRYQIIINREEAIKKAIYQAKKNDLLLLTGKSHEKSLCRGNKEYPWDEFQTVEKYVNLRFKS